MIKRIEKVLNVNGFEVSVWQDTKTKLFNITYDHKNLVIVIFQISNKCLKTKD